MQYTPISSKERIVTIDIIRGFALFGIFLVNMPSFHSPEFMGAMFGSEAGYTGIDYWVDVFFRLFVDMKFFTTFSFLFGLGFFIFIHRAEQKGLGATGLFSRRMLALLFFGMVHLIALWFGDILHTYAIAGFFLLFFYKRKIKTILIWAFSLLLVTNIFISLVLLIPSSILESSEVSSDVAGFSMVEYVNAYENYSYLELVAYRFGTEIPLILFNLIPVLIPVFAMFLIGLAAGKAGIFQDITKHLPFIKKVCLITLCISAPFVIFIGLFTLGILDWGVKQPYVIELLTSISSVFICLFYISGLTILLTRRKWQKKLRFLGYTGQMALTNYVMQTIICLSIFLGLNLYGEISLTMGTVIAIVIFAGQILFSKLWLSKFRFGPLEWLWRTFTYLKLQPMKKEVLSSTERIS